MRLDDRSAGPRPGFPRMIVFDNVTVAYSQERPALSGVNLTITDGAFTYIVGATGAGKSTLLRLVYCDLAPTQGAVIVDGVRLDGRRGCDVPALRRRMGVVFQDIGLLPDRNVYENVAFALRVIGAGHRKIRRNVPDALELVGMVHRPDAYPRQLSGGEQQRFAIARALVNNPPLLLADEPTGNLDPDTSMGIAEVLDRINQAGTTVVVATHDQPMVDAMQRRVIELSRGRLVRDEERGGYGASISDEA